MYTLTSYQAHVTNDQVDHIKLSAPAALLSISVIGTSGHYKLSAIISTDDCVINGKNISSERITITVSTNNTLFIDAWRDGMADVFVDGEDSWYDSWDDVVAEALDILNLGNAIAYNLQELSMDEFLN